VEEAFSSRRHIRYNETMSKDPIRFRLILFLIFFATVIAIGAVGFRAIEKTSFTDAVYFIIVTIATVGYGDIHPSTPPGKWFTIGLIILGVGTFLGVVANATELMLSRREKKIRMEKLNMVIGVFFSEVGTKLIRIFSVYDPNVQEIQKKLIVTEKWTHQDFQRIRRTVKGFLFEVEGSKLELEALRDFLSGQRDFLVRLLENPTLLEHESFTSLLRAVFHLVEEVAFREDLRSLPDTDRAHLAGEVKRVYLLLVDEWLAYMEHLKNFFPYLFSLSIRTNPFDRQASPIVK
jgi:voltage-gated potassium channel